MEIKKFNFIKDEPILAGKPGYFDFYHKSFSPALKDMILSDSCPHTIGLFSNWGTGKSSIIDQLGLDLKSEPNTFVFVFDAWKYQEDSLRRTFLIKLENFLKLKGYEVPENILSSFYKNRKESISRKKEISEDPILDNSKFFKRIWTQYKLVFIFLLIPFILGATFYILGENYPQNKFIIGAKSFFAYVNSIAWLGLLAGIFLKPIAEKALEKITSKIFESTKTFTEIRTQIEEEDRLNSPEQFENIFTELISFLKNGKLVIVFDNIDRVQGDIALKILSTIKTFLEVGKSKVIFLVPCDSSAINKQIRAYYKEHGEDDDEFDESEYLKKLFNVVINTPEFIEEDLFEFTSSLIDQTGEDMIKIIKNNEVLSVITKGFKKNPREIKQFINNLVSAVLVASKTDVADIVLSHESIGYFTKVSILKQKFPKAYKKLKENWSQPEKILVNEEIDQELRDFLTLTSTITTNDAEPFVYFKRPFIEATLKDANEIRKSLIDGNIEEFEKFASMQTEETKLFQYISRLLRNYKSQNRILFSIFKTQLQGFYNLNKNTTYPDSYLEASVNTLELIWNNYLELPTTAVFRLLVNLKTDKQEAMLNLHISILSNEEIKSDTNKNYLHNLIEELIKNKELLNSEQRSKIMEALRKNFENRNDILIKFNTTEKQKYFIEPEILRKIIQEVLNNQNLKSFLPILISYYQFIVDSKLTQILLSRIPQFIHTQNAETPATVPDKIAFFDRIIKLLEKYKLEIKNISDNDQIEIFNGLQNTYNQSVQTDDLQYKVVIILRWLEGVFSSEGVGNQIKDLISSYISQSTGETLNKVLKYWNESSRQNFIKDHFDTIGARSIHDNEVLSICYEMGTEDQKYLLIQNQVLNKPDLGINFLNSIGNKIPSRQKVLESMLVKAQSLPIQQKVNVFKFLQGKIAKNDDVNLKQNAIKQIYEYLKSIEQDMVQFGVSMLKEPFLSDTDDREIAKEMLDFYNTKSSHLLQSDIPVIEHLVGIQKKLQGALKDKLVFLILSNINHDRQIEIQKPLIELIDKLKTNTDEYEKDYSDLIQRLLTWPEGPQKEQVVGYVIGLLEKTPGAKTKEYLHKIDPGENENPA